MGIFFKTVQYPLLPHVLYSTHYCHTCSIPRCTYHPTFTPWCQYKNPPPPELPSLNKLLLLHLSPMLCAAVALSLCSAGVIQIRRGSYKQDVGGRARGRGRGGEGGRYDG